MSEAVGRAVQGTAVRAAAASGRRVGAGPERVKYEAGTVVPEEIARRILSGLVELEDLGALFEHLRLRADLLLGSLDQCESGEGQVATLWLSSVQCVVVGMLLAGELAKSAYASSSARTPLEESGPGGPAFESAARSYRPAHGGHPGSTV